MVDLDLCSRNAKAITSFLMITPVFERNDGDLYTTWHSDAVDGFHVSIVVPDVGEIRMTPAKAENLAEGLKRHAAYVREAIKLRG